MIKLVHEIKRGRFRVGVWQLGEWVRGEVSVSLRFDGVVENGYAISILHNPDFYSYADSFELIAAITEAQKWVEDKGGASYSYQTPPSTNPRNAGTYGLANLTALFEIDQRERSGTAAQPGRPAKQRPRRRSNETTKRSFLVMLRPVKPDDPDTPESA